VFQHNPVETWEIAEPSLDICRIDRIAGRERREATRKGSKAGNSPAASRMLQLVWRWLMFQKGKRALAMVQGADRARAGTHAENR